MWITNKKVLRYYAIPGSQSVWVLLESVGAWRRVKAGSADGVTNMAVLFSTARAHDRNVTVLINPNDNNQITNAYLL